MGYNKASAPTLPHIRYMCFDFTHAPVATAARAAAAGLVSMSTRDQARLVSLRAFMISYE